MREVTNVMGTGVAKVGPKSAWALMCGGRGGGEKAEKKMILDASCGPL